jgi:hypothetical protein
VPVSVTDSRRRQQKAISSRGKRVERQLKPLDQLGGWYVMVRITAAGQGISHISDGLAHRLPRVGGLVQDFV